MTSFHKIFIYLVVAFIGAFIGGGIVYFSKSSIQNPSSTISAPGKTEEYLFNCFKGVKIPQTIRESLDPLLENKKWGNTTNPDTRVCLTVGTPLHKALVITDNCSESCNAAAILVADLSSSQIKVIKSLETSEYFGTSFIDEILSWTPTTVTYKASGQFPDGGCFENIIHDIFAYQVRTVAIADSREEVDKTCWHSSCQEVDILKCQ